MNLFFLPLFLLALLGASPACAAEGYYNVDQAETSSAGTPQKEAFPALNTVTVTSIEKCYRQLGPKDAQDIETHYLKPYEECQRRLALKLKKEKTVKAGGTPKAAAPESPHFYRVQKDNPASSGKTEGKAAPKPSAFTQETVPLR